MKGGIISRETKTLGDDEEVVEFTDLSDDNFYIGWNVKILDIVTDMGLC